MFSQVIASVHLLPISDYSIPNLSTDQPGKKSSAPQSNPPILLSDSCVSFRDAQFFPIFFLGPTENSGDLNPQNPPIFEVNVVQNRQSTDFGVLILPNLRPGGEQLHAAAFHLRTFWKAVL